MSLSSFLQFISSIGFFIYGMKLLSDSLQDSAKKRSSKLLNNVSDKTFKSVLLGAFTTGIIQSSTATTLMTMGLVESGLMELFQALPVIMGANTGTTVTSQIIRLADIDAASPFFSLLNPLYLAPFFIFIGALQKMFFKKREALQSASLFLGAGILFYGIEQMEVSLRPLAYSSFFTETVPNFRNPFLLFLCGILFTAVLQSSSVSVGILQSVCATGLISFSVAIPLLLGMNIGKCLPECFASLSMGKKVKTLMLADLIINLSGCLIFAIILCLIPDKKLNIPASRTLIANFHTYFNIFSTLILLPFHRYIIEISERTLAKKSRI